MQNFGDRVKQIAKWVEEGMSAEDVDKAVFLGTAKKNGLDGFNVGVIWGRDYDLAPFKYFCVSSDNGFMKREDLILNGKGLGVWCKLAMGDYNIYFQDLGRIYDSWEEFRKDLMVWKLAGMS